MRTCGGCGREQLMLLPETACGNEFVWTARCGICGDWRWFHAREDRDFVRAVLETSRRRGEPGGLSVEGRREAHAAYEAGLPGCACGGRFHVVTFVSEESCLGCGRPVGEGPGGPPVEVAVRPLR
jgi:hypothetical protein